MVSIEGMGKSPETNNKRTIEETLDTLPEEIRRYFPYRPDDPSGEDPYEYIKRMNEMHTDTDKPGGSKFIEVENILEVLRNDAERIAQQIEARQDDREALLAAGANEASFLPATKEDGMPDGLPEALYYKIDGIQGKLGVVKLSEIDPEQVVIVRREKSYKNEDGVEQVPCSFTTIVPDLENMPDTDYATAIFGREGGDTGKDELWTIHPGPPIRPAQFDVIPGSSDLPAPGDVAEGEKQEVIITTVRELLDSENITESDYIKVMPGDMASILENYTVRQ